MTLTYLDQNALIALGRNARNPEFRKKLDAALESGAVTVVVSSWHLVETANTTKLENAVELAQFIDSLKPQWLLERRDIQKIEVAAQFFTFARMDYRSPACVTTRSAAFASLSGAPDAPRFDIPSAEFVKQWIQHPEQLKQLVHTLRQNTESLTALRDATKHGRITGEVRRNADEQLVRLNLPDKTPAGLTYGKELADEFVRQATIPSIPTLAIETAISEHEWVAAGRDDRNTVIDKFHMISALPYVDEVVSDDKFFHEIYPVAVSTGHVRAKLLHVADFIERFH